MSSSPASTAADAPRRASGRVRKQPEAYAPGFAGNAKRKRSDVANGGPNGGDDVVEMPEDYVSDEDIPSEDDEPAEEEVRERKQRARKAPSGEKRPATKKAKVNGTTLPIRSVSNAKRAPRKKNKATFDLDLADADGLYAKVFGGNSSPEDVAGQWIQDFHVHESRALADVINFVLRCAGCHSKVAAEDIEDPDNVGRRLTDIQEEFQASQPTDYPLIGKGRPAIQFRDTMTGFLKALIKSIAATDLLYQNTALIENIEEWFSTMTSAADRAFRHTSTVASLVVISALCEVGQENAQEMAAQQRQAESERKKARPNKNRLNDIEQRASESGKIVEFIELQVRDWFTVIFIHRYRDFDPIVRKDCIAAFGNWVVTLPDVFLDGKHLRYPGWLLSDTSPVTRGEVLKQLQTLYKARSMIGGLQSFTDRFRERLVEMATSDSESNVRCLGIELLTVLRENGLLEPDDIDAVGRLLYDADLQVRTIVAGFFADNVQDLYNSKIDDLGGEMALAEALPEVREDNDGTPRLAWLKYKSLAEMMVAYDPDESSTLTASRLTGSVNPAGTDSRFTLAADALYNKIMEIEDWQSLIGYLLFDHSARRVNGTTDDELALLKQQCVLDDAEEIVLLHVAGASLKRTMRDLADHIASKAKLTKKQKEALSADQEEVARNLTTLIPKLLRKFGDSPVMAAAVVKMEAILNDVPRDANSYGSLLDDMAKLFMSHDTEEVLTLSRDAILQGRSNDLNDVTEEKFGSLWEDVVGNLSELVDPKTVTVRGAAEHEDLLAINTTLLRIVLLSQKSNCIAALDDQSLISKAASNGTEYHGAIDYIIALITHANPNPDFAVIESSDAALEDQIAARAADAAYLYMQWQILHVRTSVTSPTKADLPYAELEALAARRDTFFNTMLAVLQARKSADEVCVTMTRVLLELTTSARMLANLPRKAGASSEYEALIVELPKECPKLVLAVFAAAERRLAKWMGKRLETGPSAEQAEEAEMDILADPIDEDDDEEEAAEEHDGLGNATQAEHDDEAQSSQQRKENRLLKTLLAERDICELTRSIIFAVHAGFLDAAPTKRRLQRNKGKLGPNFKELLNFLDLDKVAKATGKKGKGKGKVEVTGGKADGGREKKGAGARNYKSNAIVADDELEDQIEDGEDDEDEEALRRRGLLDEADGEEAEGHTGDANGDEDDDESVLGD